MIRFWSHVPFSQIKTCITNFIIIVVDLHIYVISMSGKSIIVRPHTCYCYCTSIFWFVYSLVKTNVFFQYESETIYTRSLHCRLFILLTTGDRMYMDLHGFAKRVFQISAASESSTKKKKIVDLVLTVVL